MSNMRTVEEWCLLLPDEDRATVTGALLNYGDRIMRLHYHVVDFCELIRYSIRLGLTFKYRNEVLGKILNAVEKGEKGEVKFYQKYLK